MNSNNSMAEYLKQIKKTGERTQNTLVKMKQNKANNTNNKKGIHTDKRYLKIFHHYNHLGITNQTTMRFPDIY